jgi:predicted extracellular nuclease
VWVIAVHFKSKSEDTNSIEYTLPRRLAQAQFVAGLYAEVVVLGDMNDYPNSQPLGVMTGSGMVSLMPYIPAPSRYTYNFRGVSQVLDHILVSPNFFGVGQGIIPEIFHLNADYPVLWEGDDSVPRRASDHDPMLVRVIELPYSIWLPATMRP